jgi:hypothetical protein
MDGAKGEKALGAHAHKKYQFLFRADGKHPEVSESAGNERQSATVSKWRIAYDSCCVFIDKTANKMDILVEKLTKQ